MSCVNEPVREAELCLWNCKSLSRARGRAGRIMRDKARDESLDQKIKNFHIILMSQT